jgi:hypothetical protein
MATIRRNNICMTDRYQFDFKTCTPARGWAQLDTRQDASYYGNWINPSTFELFSYCEGDITHTQCSDADDFKQSLRECIEWHREREYFIGIDPMERPEIKDALISLGFESELH